MRPKQQHKARHDDLFRARLDEQVWDRWVNDPCFQYFAGEEFFQHELPHERSGMSHWRKRIGDHLDILLAESLRIAHDTGALKKSDVTAGQGGDHSHSRPDPAKPTW